RADPAARGDRRCVRGRSAAAAQPRGHDLRAVRRLCPASADGVERRWNGDRMTRGPLAFVLRLVFIAALLGLWELVVTVFDMPAFLVPPPSRVALGFYQGIVTSVYGTHLYATLGETLIGFALACVLAFTLGSAIALSRTVEYYLHPLIVMVQSLPKIA